MRPVSAIQNGSITELCKSGKDQDADLSGSALRRLRCLYGLRVAAWVWFCSYRCETLALFVSRRVCATRPNSPVDN